MSLMAKKSFCSWICPVGTVSEGAYKLGGRLFGRNFRIWRWPDLCLRGIKYLLLLLFVKLILLDMPADALAGFLDAPYWAVSDVKMLRFFTRMSVTTVTVLAGLALLSLAYRNFWCRYLCPYGALLGLASIFSPFKIRRNATGCTGCRRCTAACPSGLAVHSCTAVSSPECTGCLSCVARCPERNVLAMLPVFRRRPLPAWIFPAVVLFVFMAGIGAGMASGHWNSSLTHADYQRLLPLVPYLSH
jgi:polyferredoxin